MTFSKEKMTNKSSQGVHWTENLNYLCDIYPDASNSIIITVL